MVRGLVIMCEIAESVGLAVRTWLVTRAGYGWW